MEQSAWIRRKKQQSPDSRSPVSGSPLKSNVNGPELAPERFEMRDFAVTVKPLTGVIRSQVLDAITPHDEPFGLVTIQCQEFMVTRYFVYEQFKMDHTQFPGEWALDCEWDVIATEYPTFLAGYRAIEDLYAKGAKHAK